ncbi:hypothetical protein LTR53_019650 [Teratosphaeriaceae sp. CCFEE 6253]|nr:hypothetical protein LTR53_019650 [Teratosphaeriaceae sp. CCFEE 6253]
MIETQKHWYQPALGALGWHIGLWNLIGGIGFTLCPVSDQIEANPDHGEIALTCALVALQIFGFSTANWRILQASVSTFWGSWAFLIGSVIQLYESLSKHPVEQAKSA